VANHGAAYAAICIESGTPPLVPAEASSSLLGEHVMPATDGSRLPIVGTE